MRTSTLLAAGLMTLGAVAVPATVSAQPQNVVCTGTIGAIAVDNVEVPEFARCILNGTTVLGSVEVKPFARLNASFTSVRGSVQATEATSVVSRSCRAASPGCCATASAAA
jgi:hypothetical protein